MKITAKTCLTTPTLWLAWAEAAELKVVDPTGIELLVQGGGRSEVIRIVFEAPITRADMVRPNLVKMVKKSHQWLAEHK